MDKLLSVRSHHPVSLDSTKGLFVKVDCSRPIAYNQLRDELVLAIHDSPPDYWFLDLRFIKDVLQFLRGNQSPTFVQMQLQLFVCDAVKLNPNPAAYPNVSGPVELLRRGFDQHCLNANSRGYHHCNMAVVV